MISNQDRSLRDISQALAEGAMRNPTIGQHRQQVQLINQHSFDNQDIINVHNRPREFTQQINVTQAVHQRSLSASRNLQEDLVVQQNSHPGELQHDPLFYGVGAPLAPPVNPPAAEPVPYFHQEGIGGNASNFRVYQRIPWWVLLIIFLVSLAAFGGVIVWMFNRRRAVSPISANSTITSLRPISPITSVSIPNVSILRQNTPVIEQKKVISVDQSGNIVETTQTKTINGQVVTNSINTNTTSTIAPITSLNPVTSTVIQTKKAEEAKTAVQTPKIVQPIPVAGKQGVFCQNGSFSFNNKCYSCPNNQFWNDSNCVSSVKHLKRQ